MADRREFLKTVFLGSLAAVTKGAKLRTTKEIPRRKPNILVIIADDLGYADVGFHGCQDIPTPNLDSLAEKGVVCSNGYVSHPWCAPTRAGLMTGRYQHRFGFEHNPFPYDPNDEISGLPPGEVTLAEALKQGGYVCGAIGKWHLGAHPLFHHPLTQGFDEFFGFLGGGHGYFGPYTKPESEYRAPLWRNWARVTGSDDYLTDVLGEEAVTFIERHRDKPFFLYLAFNAPHVPLQAPKGLINQFVHLPDRKRRIYAAMVKAMDEAIGKVLKTLRRLGLEEDTLIFFLSDNGGPIGPRGNGSRNDPLRGGKGGLYEGGIRVPFVVQWKGNLPAGKVYREPVICLDIFATALSAAGVSLPTDRKIDGVNLLPYLRGEKTGPPHERLFWRTGGPGWHLVVREGRYKLLRLRRGKWVELYDLEEDIGERHNLAQSRPDIVERLTKAVSAWDAELMPPRFLPRRPPKKRASRRPMGR